MTFTDSTGPEASQSQAFTFPALVGMPALVDIFGDDACLQFGGGTYHPSNAGQLAEAQYRGLDHLLRMAETAWSIPSDEALSESNQLGQSQELLALIASSYKTQTGRRGPGRRRG